MSGIVAAVCETPAELEPGSAAWQDLGAQARSAASLARWLVALRMAAIVSGCYVLSSNRAGADARGQEFGGHGWIVDPLGDLVAETSAGQPFVCHTLDLDLVARAQAEYRCYVRD